MSNTPSPTTAAPSSIAPSKRSRKSCSRKASSSRWSASLFLLHLRSALVAIIILPDRGADFLPRHVRPGPQFQHHVARRHRHRHRRDGGRGHHHDRKRPQAPRARPGQKTALGHHSRRRRRGRSDAVLLAAGHHRFLHPGLHACRRRKAGCSNRWPLPRPIRWPRRPCYPSPSRPS